MICIADKKHLLGQDSDPEVGLLFEPARHFDPTVGRWLTNEPAGFEAGGEHRHVGQQQAQPATGR